MKAELRKRLLNTRENIENKAQKCQQIEKNLMEQPFFETAQTIMVYLSIDSEVDTLELTKKMLLLGKRLCAPVCMAGGMMAARSFSSFDELKRGRYGILEPQGDEVFDIDLILVPGLGFNERFHRIGYGAGYYDRFLSNTSAITCGLFYDKQRADFLEESHDLPLDYIVTETKILKRA